MAKSVKRFTVGDVWIVQCRTDPDGYWRFQIVAETLWQGVPYYVALKLDVPPTSLQVVVFDREGVSVESGGPFAYNFFCTRRSRRMQDAAVRPRET